MTDASRYLGWSQQTIRRAEQAGKLKCYRTPGGWRRIEGSELLRLRPQWLRGADE